MGGTVLNTTVKEKDLGLTISADMKVSEQCGIAAAKANQILGLMCSHTFMLSVNQAFTLCICFYSPEVGAAEEQCR